MNKTCIYCGEQKEIQELSEEHIWPSALGGNALGDFWRTSDVCKRCNSIAGVFVDGEFIKGLAGSIEHFYGTDFVNIDDPLKAIFPLAYLGKITDVSVEAGHEAEFWAGPCGANVIHIRPKDSDEAWHTFAGGDPRSQRRGGRVYLAFTSNNEFWIKATLCSVRAHFKDLRPIYIINASVGDRLAPSFREPDLSDTQQARDLVTVDEVLAATKRGESHRMHLVVHTDTGARFLAKVALGIGYKTYGVPFLATTYASHLRHAFREANAERRSNIPIRGRGYLASSDRPTLPGFRGAWVLVLMSVRPNMLLFVVAPSGTEQAILITDDAGLIQVTDHSLDSGAVWVVVPTLGKAVGPISLPEYVLHQAREKSNDQLNAIEAQRVDKSQLPPC